MVTAVRFRRSVAPSAFVALAALSLAACESEVGDTGVSGVVPAPAGPDRRIREIANPQSPLAAPHLGPVAVSGAVVVAVDMYDETENGRSRGTIYVQDLGSNAPYSGISLFAPTFVPGNLKVGVGDVLDLRGTFQANPNIGTAVFADGAVLPQISQPTATFRFEDRTPPPADLDAAPFKGIRELETFEDGRQWIGMIVTVRNVTVERDVNAERLSSGRLNVELLPRAPNAQNGCNAPFPKPPSIVNELTNVQTLNIPAGTTIKSLTGVVTFFCNFHIAPRSLEDVEL